MSTGARFFGHSGIAAIVAAAIAIGSLVPQPVEAQKTRRVNRLIETLESGKPAFTGDSWIFVDREHRPYDVTELRQTLTTMLARIGRTDRLKRGVGRPCFAAAAFTRDVTSRTCA